MKEKTVTTKPCLVCKNPLYKVISQEKFSQVIRCKECGSEYSRITDSDQLKIRNLVEKKMKSGEIDDHVRDTEEKKKIDERLKKSHKKFIQKILK